MAAGTEEGRVSATPHALELIERLRSKYGPLVFLQSGGCCDGSAPFCGRRGELPIGPGDVLVGTLAGAAFYMDGDQYQRWRRPRLVIDVADEAGDSFSLEGTEGVHFVLTPQASTGRVLPPTKAGPRPQAPAPLTLAGRASR